MSTFSFYHITINGKHYIGLHEGYSAHNRIKQHEANAWNPQSSEYNTNLSKWMRTNNIKNLDGQWFETDKKQFFSALMGSSARKDAEAHEIKIISETIQRHGRNNVLNERI